MESKKEKKTKKNKKIVSKKWKKKKIPKTWNNWSTHEKILYCLEKRSFFAMERDQKEYQRLLKLR